MKAFRPLGLHALRSTSRARTAWSAESEDRRRQLHVEGDAASSKSGVEEGLRDSKPAARVRDLDGSSSLALFREVVEEQQAPRDSATHGLQKPAERLALYQSIASLQELLRTPNTSTATCFAYFVSDVRPKLVGSDNARPRPELLPRRARNALQQRLLEAWKRAEEKDLPEVSHISQVLKEMDSFHRETWALLVLGVLQAVVAIKAQPDAHPSIEGYEGAMGRRVALLRDLVKSWKVFYAPAHDLAVPRAYDVDREPFCLPPVRPQQLRHLIRSKKSTLAFGALYPAYSPRGVDKVILATVASYVVLTDSAMGSRAVEKMAAPLVATVEQVMKFSYMGLGSLPDDQRFGEYPVLAQYLRSRWHAVMEWLESRATLPQALRSPRAISDMASLRPRLDAVLKSRSVPTVDRLWAEFWGPEPVPSQHRVAQLQQKPELFDQFGMVYMALKQPDKAIHAWNSMGQVGMQPTVRTFTSGMDGCKWARNPAGIAALWSRLIESGMQLDVAAWTTRVSGLMEAGDAEMGLQALQELGKMWKGGAGGGAGSAAQPSYIQPSIQPVNAALAALLRMRGLSAARKVLSWAGQHGIEPDIYTFNILLRPMIREGLTDEVDKVFEMMKQQGIRADATTFTVLLEGTLSGFASRSPQEQLDTVQTMFAQMAAAGVQPNMQTLGKMIHLLLQEGGKAEAAVKAVLAHAWDQGMEPTPHIYTMLAGHYFSRNPPDLAAVKALIDNRRLGENNQSVDHVFWEHIITGYAQAGDTASALKAFKKLEDAGTSSITLRTLEVLLQGLIRAGTLESASRVVQAARRHAKRVHREQDEWSGARYWRHHFWHLARQHGLLGEGELSQLAAAESQG